jgi:hypothetical protein
MYVRVQVINVPVLFIRRLKINHKSCGSYAFILEEDAAANSYLMMMATFRKIVTKNLSAPHTISKRDVKR